jgi:cell division protein FtsW (lipid II flippase)
LHLLLQQPSFGDTTTITLLVVIVLGVVAITGTKVEVLVVIVVVVLLLYYPILDHVNWHNARDDDREYEYGCGDGGNG